MKPLLSGIGPGASPYFFIARIRVLMAMAYRFEVFASIVGQVIIMASSVFIWNTAYRGDPVVEGVSRSQMLVYSVVSVLLGIFFYSGVADTIRDRVSQGQISTDLIRPVEPLLLWLFEDIGNSISAFLTKGWPLLLFGFVMAGPILPASPEALLLFLPSCVLAYLILWLLTALVGMVSFWTIELGQMNLVKNALVNVLSGNFVPIWFFPAWFGQICAWLPFVYTFQGALGIFVGKTAGLAALRILGLQALWALALGGLLLAVWRRARGRLLVQGG